MGETLTTSCPFIVFSTDCKLVFLLGPIRDNFLSLRDFSDLSSKSVSPRTVCCSITFSARIVIVQYFRSLMMHRKMLETLQKFCFEPRLLLNQQWHDQLCPSRIWLQNDTHKNNELYPSMRKPLKISSGYMGGTRLVFTAQEFLSWIVSTSSYCLGYWRLFLTIT